MANGPGEKWPEDAHTPRRAGESTTGEHPAARTLRGNRQPYWWFTHVNNLDVTSLHLLHKSVCHISYRHTNYINTNK